MSPSEALSSFLQKKPLVLVTLGEKYRDAIEAKGEIRDKLTIAVPHEELKGIRPPALCFIQLPASHGTDVLVGVIQNKMEPGLWRTRPEDRCGLAPAGRQESTAVEARGQGVGINRQMDGPIFGGEMAAVVRET